MRVWSVVGDTRSITLLTCLPSGVTLLWHMSLLTCPVPCRLSHVSHEDLLSSIPVCTFAHLLHIQPLP